MKIDGLQRLLRVEGRLWIEPRLRPLFLTTAAAELKAQTASDGSLVFNDKDVFAGHLLSAPLIDYDSGRTPRRCRGPGLRFH